MRLRRPSSASTKLGIPWIKSLEEAVPMPRIVSTVNEDTQRDWVAWSKSARAVFQVSRVRWCCMPRVNLFVVKRPSVDVNAHRMENCCCKLMIRLLSSSGSVALPMKLACSSMMPVEWVQCSRKGCWPARSKSWFWRALLFVRARPSSMCIKGQHGYGLLKGISLYDLWR